MKVQIGLWDIGEQQETRLDGGADLRAPQFSDKTVNFRLKVSGDVEVEDLVMFQTKQRMINMSQKYGRNCRTGGRGGSMKHR